MNSGNLKRKKVGLNNDDSVVVIHEREMSWFHTSTRDHQALAGVLCLTAGFQLLGREKFETSLGRNQGGCERQVDEVKTAEVSICRLARYFIRIGHLPLKN